MVKVAGNIAYKWGRDNEKGPPSERVGRVEEPNKTELLPTLEGYEADETCTKKGSGASRVRDMSTTTTDFDGDLTFVEETGPIKDFKLEVISSRQVGITPHRSEYQIEAVLHDAEQSKLGGFNPCSIGRTAVAERAVRERHQRVNANEIPRGRGIDIKGQAIGEVIEVVLRSNIDTPFEVPERPGTRWSRPRGELIDASAVVRLGAVCPILSTEGDLGTVVGKGCPSAIRVPCPEDGDYRVIVDSECVTCRTGRDKRQNHH